MTTDPFAALGLAGAEAARMSFADGRQAVRMVRAHAVAWGIDRARVGLVGFSAGAGVTMAAVTASDAADRPDFAAPIYGMRIAGPMIVPADAPPLFLACAADDDAIPSTESVAIWEAWRSAGRSAELHVFASGGHGFGTKRTGHPSDAWVDLFERWLDDLEPTAR